MVLGLCQWRSEGAQSSGGGQRHAPAADCCAALRRGTAQHGRGAAGVSVVCEPEGSGRLDCMPA